MIFYCIKINLSLPPPLLPVLTVAPRRVEFKLVKWCPYSQIDTIDDTLSDIFKDDQNIGKTQREGRKKEKEIWFPILRNPRICSDRVGVVENNQIFVFQ